MVSTAPFSTISLIPHNLLHRAYVAFTSQLLPPKSISIEDKSWLLGTWLVTALVLLFDVDNVIGLRISADEAIRAASGSLRPQRPAAIAAAVLKVAMKRCCGTNQSAVPPVTLSSEAF
jgi:hypothetical protein